MQMSDTEETTQMSVSNKFSVNLEKLKSLRTLRN